MDPESITLGAHVLAGFVALFAGMGAIGTTKGGLRHRRFGRTYVYAMAFVSGSALALLGFDPTTVRQFLALIAVFSFYFAFSGYRVLSRKRPADDPAPVDWTALGLFGLASVGLLAMGGLFWLDGNEFAPVVLVFGGAGTIFGVSDVRTFAGPSDAGDWLGEHVGRMGGGYVATVTAFSAVNFTFLPPVARWLWPILLGTPAIALAIRHYEAEFGLA